MPQKKNLKQTFNKIGSYLKGIVFPRDIKCIFCGEELDNTSLNSTCQLCYNALPFIVNPCPRCGGTIKEENSGVCQDCKRNNFNFTQAISVFDYKDDILKTIYKLKYSGKKYLAKPLAEFMAQKFALTNIQPDYITFVPAHANRIKTRGYNQSQLIAEEFSKLTQCSILELCSKIIDTPSQTNLSYKERRENVNDSFSFNKEHKNKIKDKTILIIDDTFTTGATTSELSSVILKAGAKQCFVLTLAHVNIEQHL